MRRRPAPRRWQRLPELCDSERNVRPLRPSVNGWRAHLVCAQLKENNMSLGLILLIVLVLLLVGVIPSWPHSRSWGYGPSGGLGLVLVIVVVLLLMGRI